MKALKNRAEIHPSNATPNLNRLEELEAEKKRQEEFIRQKDTTRNLFKSANMYLIRPLTTKTESHFMKGLIIRCLSQRVMLKKHLLKN